MQCEHLFSYPLYNDLWRHNLIDSRGFVSAGEKELKIYKGFLEDQVVIKRAENYKERSRIVNIVQELLLFKNRTDRENYYLYELVHSLGLEFTDEGCLVSLPVVPTERKYPGVREPSLSLFERQILEEEKRSKVLKRDLKVLDEWLHGVGSKSKVIKPTYSKETDVKELKRTCRERTRRRQEEMAAKRRNKIYRFHSDIDKQWRSICGLKVSHVTSPKKSHLQISTPTVLMVPKRKIVLSVSPRRKTDKLKKISRPTEETIIFDSHQSPVDSSLDILKSGERTPDSTVKDPTSKPRKEKKLMVPFGDYHRLSFSEGELLTNEMAEKRLQLFQKMIDRLTREETPEKKIRRLQQDATEKEFEKLDKNLEARMYKDIDRFSMIITDKRRLYIGEPKILCKDEVEEYIRQKALGGNIRKLFDFIPKHKYDSDAKTVKVSYPLSSKYKDISNLLKYKEITEKTLEDRMYKDSDYFSMMLTDKRRLYIGEPKILCKDEVEEYIRQKALGGNLSKLFDFIPKHKYDSDAKTVKISYPLSSKYKDRSSLLKYKEIPEKTVKDIMTQKDQELKQFIKPSFPITYMDGKKDIEGEFIETNKIFDAAKDTITEILEKTVELRKDKSLISIQESLELKPSEESDLHTIYLKDEEYKIFDADSISNKIFISCEDTKNYLMKSVLEEEEREKEERDKKVSLKIFDSCEDTKNYLIKSVLEEEEREKEEREKKVSLKILDSCEDTKNYLMKSVLEEEEREKITRQIFDICEDTKKYLIESILKEEDEKEKEKEEEERKVEKDPFLRQEFATWGDRDQKYTIVEPPKASEFIDECQSTLIELINKIDSSEEKIKMLDISLDKDLEFKKQTEELISKKILTDKDLQRKISSENLYACKETISDLMKNVVISDEDIKKLQFEKYYYVKSHTEDKTISKKPISRDDKDIESKFSNGILKACEKTISDIAKKVENSKELISPRSLDENEKHRELGKTTKVLDSCKDILSDLLQKTENLEQEGKEDLFYRDKRLRDPIKELLSHEVVMDENTGVVESKISNGVSDSCEETISDLVKYVLISKDLGFTDTHSEEEVEEIKKPVKPTVETLKRKSDIIKKDLNGIDLKLRTEKFIQPREVSILPSDSKSEVLAQESIPKIYTLDEISNKFLPQTSVTELQEKPLKDVHDLTKKRLDGSKAFSNLAEYTDNVFTTLVHLEDVVEIHPYKPYLKEKVKPCTEKIRRVEMGMTPALINFYSEIKKNKNGESDIKVADTLLQDTIKVREEKELSQLPLKEQDTDMSFSISDVSDSDSARVLKNICQKVEDMENDYKRKRLIKEDNLYRRVDGLSVSLSPIDSEAKMKEYKILDSQEKVTEEKALLADDFQDTKDILKHFQTIDEKLKNTEKRLSMLAEQKILEQSSKFFTNNRRQKLGVSPSMSKEKLTDPKKLKSKRESIKERQKQKLLEPSTSLAGVSHKEPSAETIIDDSSKSEWPAINVENKNIYDVSNTIFKVTQAFKSNKGLLLNKILYNNLDDARQDKK